MYVLLGKRGGGGAQMPFSRRAEADADLIGLKLMVRCTVGIISIEELVSVAAGARRCHSAGARRPRRT